MKKVTSGWKQQLQYTQRENEGTDKTGNEEIDALNVMMAWYLLKQKWEERGR